MAAPTDPPEGEPPPTRSEQDGDESSSDTDSCELIDVYAQAPADYDGTCLRPLGLCELGGSCDACWYNNTIERSIGERPTVSAGEPAPESDQDETSSKG